MNPSKTQTETGLKFDCITLADSGLKPHDIIAHMPRWEDEDPRALSLRKHLQDGGEIEPIKITPEREIVDPDSRERWRAAKLLGLETVPVMIITDRDAENVCISTLVHRRHLTKSALAYLIHPLLKIAFETSREKRLQNLKNANVSRKCTERTIAEFSDQLGIGRHFLFDAKKVHEIFARDAEYKALMEPRILSEPIGGEHEDKRPVGLGAVIAGYAGRGKTLDQPRADRQQLDLFSKSTKGIFNYWPELTPQQRGKAMAEIEQQAAQHSPEDRAAIVTMLRDMAKRIEAIEEDAA